MSPASSSRSFETSLTTSPRSTVELPHRGSSSVEDTTYLGRLFSRSAHSPVLAAHRVANHSSLFRPSSRASVPSDSANEALAHCSRSWPPDWPNQPPSLNPSAPSGSWTTPSSETFVLMTIFPIVLLPCAGAAFSHPVQAPRRRETGRPPAAQFAPRPASTREWAAGRRRKEGDAER